MSRPKTELVNIPAAAAGISCLAAKAGAKEEPVGAQGAHKPESLRAEGLLDPLAQLRPAGVARAADREAARRAYLPVVPQARPGTVLGAGEEPDDGVGAVLGGQAAGR